jgi:putative IMPACT (imprinted ancient) family translation regulator
MQEIAAGKIVVKKSRFFAHLYAINQKEDIQEIIKTHHLRYNKANHHCYALRLCKQKNSLIEDFSDDGEVGRPGRVLLQILNNHHLSNHALVVSRVFGGIKLGVGGVSRAFREVGEGVVLYHKNPNKEK